MLVGHTLLVCMLGPVSVPAVVVVAATKLQQSNVLARLVNW